VRLAALREPFPSKEKSFTQSRQARKAKKKRI